MDAVFGMVMFGLALFGAKKLGEMVDGMPLPVPVVEEKLFQFH